MGILFINAHVITMDEEERILKNAFVLVEGTNIAYVGEIRPEGTFEEIDCTGKVLLPGFVDAHSHVPMTLLRGYGGGADLQTWLTKYIFPVEDKLDGRAVSAGTKLALAELIAAGVTTFADMYMFCDEIIEATLEAGLSANIARGTTFFGETFDPETHEGFLDTKRLVEKWHGYHKGQILMDACIHGEYTSKPALWKAVADYAKEKNIGMHIHLSETKAEHENCLANYGKTPAALLADYGVFDTRTIAAHCVWTSEADWALMAEKGVTAVHNPVSNLKLGSGIAPIAQMKKAGVTIALGTDGVASNNSHDMLEEIKLAALLQSGTSYDPCALSTMDALKMATCHGAKALGRQTGVIKEGYVADIILLDFERPHLTPCHSVLDNLIYAARGSDVVMNMARGRIIYRDGKHLTLNLEEIYREVYAYATPLLFGSETT